MIDDSNPTEDVRTNEQGPEAGEPFTRCFRCGQLYPSEFVRRISESVPAIFSSQPLCATCVEVVTAERDRRDKLNRSGWWAAPTLAH